MPYYKQKDGHYRVEVSYVDSNGSYKKAIKDSKQVTTAAHAKRVEAELQAKVDNHDNVSSISFSQLFNLYLEAKKDELKANSIRQHVNTFKNHLESYFGNYKIDKITPTIIQNWKSFINENYNFNISYKKTLFKNLNAVLNFGVKYYGLVRNNASFVGTFKDPNLIVDNTLHFWTFDQFALFFNAMEKDLTSNNALMNYYVYFNILFFCGLRKGECGALTWNDLIDYKGAKCLKINKSINQKVKGTKYEVTTPKNKSSIRIIPLANSVVKLLQKHYKLCKSTLYGFKDSWFICGGYEPLADTTVTNVFNKYASIAKLEHIRIHDIRHSFASMLINNNVPIKPISKLMGHSTVEQTWNRYGHLYPEAENEAIATINKLTQK